jgi:hypothetical protein
MDGNRIDTGQSTRQRVQAHRNGGFGWIGQCRLNRGNAAYFQVIGGELGLAQPKAQRATLTYKGMPTIRLKGKVSPSDIPKYREGRASGMA